MSVTHRIAFAFEILLAELIFLFPCEKRQHFFFRYLLAHWLLWRRLTFSFSIFPQPRKC